MTKIVAFSGVSNSGKTTLIEGLCKILIPDFKVGVVKHDPKNKVVFDTIGKDSQRFFAAGADVAVISPEQTAIRLNKGLHNDIVMDLLNHCEPLDYIFIEGFKTMPYRRICVVRDDFVDNDIENADAIATINISQNLAQDLTQRAQNLAISQNLAQNPIFAGKIMLDLDNHREILRWIDSLRW